MGEKGHFNIDLNDEVVRGSIILEGGEMRWPPPPSAAPPPAPPKAQTAIVKPPETSPFQQSLQEAGLTAGAQIRVMSFTGELCRNNLSYETE